MAEIIEFHRGGRWRVPAGLVATEAPEPHAGDRVEWLDEDGAWRPGYLFLVLTGAPREYRVMAAGRQYRLPRGRVRRPR